MRRESITDSSSESNSGEPSFTAILDSLISQQEQYLILELHRLEVMRREVENRKAATP
jgi:hypothetical protein